jgi:dTDP-4-amino-4,6-dideoxygalactose transaminase
MQTLIHYPTPPHLQAAYSDLGFGRERLPVAERLSREVLSLPIGPHLGEQAAHSVAAAVAGWCDSAPAVESGTQRVSA